MSSLLKRTIKAITGMTLAETMIAMGLLSAVSLGIIQLVNTISKSQKKMDQTFEASQALTKVMFALQDEESCSQTLKDIKPTTNNSRTEESTVTTGIKNASGESIMAIGDVLGQGGSGRIVLKSIYVNNLKKANYPTIEPSTVRVVLEFTKGGKSVGVKTIKRSVEAEVLLAETSDRITSCLARKTAYNQANCTALGGIWNGLKCDSIIIDAKDESTPAVTSIGILSITQEATFENEVSLLGFIQDTTKEVTIADQLQVEEGLVVQGNSITALAGDINIEENLEVTNNLSLGNQIDDPGDQEVTLTEDSHTTQSYRINSNLDLKGRVRDSIADNVININGQTKISGKLEVMYSSTFRIDGGNLEIISPPSLSNVDSDELITKKHASQMFDTNLGNIFTNHNREQLISNIISDTSSAKITWIRDGIVKYALDDILDDMSISGPKPCSANQYVTQIKYTGNGKFEYACTPDTSSIGMGNNSSCEQDSQKVGAVGPTGSTTLEVDCRADVQSLVTKACPGGLIANEVNLSGEIECVDPNKLYTNVRVFSDCYTHGGTVIKADLYLDSHTATNKVTCRLKSACPAGWNEARFYRRKFLTGWSIWTGFTYDYTYGYYETKPSKTDTEYNNYACW